MGLFSMTPSAAFAGKVFDNKRATEPMIKMTAFKPSFTWEFKSERLERAIPETEGVSSLSIFRFLKKIEQDKTLNFHSISIVRNGKLLCEASFGAERTDVWKYSFSACKSVVSLAIGLLVDDGALFLDEKVVDIFAKEIPPLAKIKLKDLTVEDLLTMRSPVLFAEIDSAIESDWLKGYFSAPIKGECGEEFRYNSLNTYILSAIIAKKAQKSLTHFLDERLFSPLGIATDSWYWERCPQGVEKGGWGLYIYQEDFCKIAQLVLQKGIWKGSRLLSEEYIDTATTPHVCVTQESALFDYGYHIWVGKQADVFLFNGMLGQNIIGFKRNGIVVAVNAGTGEFFQQSNFFKYVFEFFDSDFPSVLPLSRKNYNKLSRFIDSLSLYRPPKSGLLKQINNKRISRKKAKILSEVRALSDFQFRFFKGYEQSVGLLPLVLQIVHSCFASGFESLSFEYEGEKAYMLYKEKAIQYKIPLGFLDPEISELSFGENRFLVATTAKFKSDEYDRQTLIIRVDFLEFPSSRILKLVLLNDETAMLYHEELPGKDFAIETVREHASEYLDKPLLASVVEKIGLDFFEFKAERAFAPELILKKEKKQ